MKEGKERVSAALVNAGYEFPLKRITVNLAPPSGPKAETLRRPERGELLG